MAPAHNIPQHHTIKFCPAALATLIKCTGDNITVTMKAFLSLVTKQKNRTQSFRELGAITIFLKKLMACHLIGMY